MLAIAVSQSALMLNMPPSSRASFAPTVGSVPACDFPANKNPLWEQSLLAIAEGQLATMLNLPPSSRAGSLPQFGSVPACDFPANKNPLWEQSLLTIAEGQLASMLNLPPSSRASFAPTVWIGASLRFPCQQKSPVGAKLARDSSVSVCLDVGRAAVIASKLCSHSLDRCQPAISLPTKIPCGSKACSR